MSHTHRELDWLDWFGRSGLDRRPPRTTDRNSPLNLSPHYSDPIWKEAQTLFGREDRSIRDYVYSDRLWQWDYEKTEQAFKVANEQKDVVRSSARWIEVALSHFLGQPVEVLHVMAGVNLTSGYPYWVAGYRAAKQERPSE